MSASKKRPARTVIGHVVKSRPGVALSIKGLATVLGVSEQTIYNYRVRDKDPLPTENVEAGSSVRVFCRPDKLKAWAKRNEVEVNAKALEKALKPAA